VILINGPRSVRLSAVPFCLGALVRLGLPTLHEIVGLLQREQVLNVSG